MSESGLGAVLIVHAFATIAMSGLCWFVQVVHYPLFIEVGGERFTRYEAEHVRRTTVIVAPLMLAELATACLLAFASLGGDGGVAPVLAWIGLGLLAVVWGCTFGVQVPLHGRLQREFEEGVVRRLVAANWVRTVAWTARGVVALLMMRPIGVDGATFG